MAAISAALLSILVLGVGMACAASPTLSIDPPSAVTYTSAHVSGTVDPGEEDAPIYLEYTTDPSSPLWTEVFLETIPAGSGATPISGEAISLTPGTEYFVRLDAYTTGYNLSPEESFTTHAVAPPSVTIDPVTTFTGTTAHLTGTINPNAPEAAPVTDPAVEAAFRTSWHFECSPACPGLNGTVGADDTPNTVEADASGLSPNTAYEVSLVGENLGGAEDAGPEAFTTNPIAPQVSRSTAAPLRTEATLGGKINPGGLGATYHFEYGLTTAYGHTTPTEGVAAGISAVAVSASISGLAEGTGYHYRLVAENSVEAVDGPDGIFATTTRGSTADSCPNAAVRSQQSAGYLPDCRAYEQVSPVEKEGADVNGDAAAGGSSGEVHVAASGNAVAYSSFGAFANAPGGGWPSWYRAVRGGAGWSSSSLTPAFVAGGTPPANTASVTALTSDLSKAIVSTNAPLTGNAPPGVYNLFVQDNTSGAHGLVTDLGPPPSLLPPPPLQVGASADLRHVFFLSEANLTPEATGFGWKLYESVDGATRLAGIGPPPGNESFSGVFPAMNRSSDRMVSDDGSRVYFVGPDRILYVREDGTTTRRVSPAGSVEDRFFTATPDGSTVLYAMTSVGSGGGLESTLVRTDVETGTTETLSGNGDSSEEFFAVLKASDDLRYVYFLSGQSSGTTMWIWHDGSRTQIAQIAAGDKLAEASAVSPYASAASTVSPDGQTLLFVSGTQLTAYDNEGHREVYRYRPAAGALDCISCPPSGAPPRGDASLVDWYFRSTANLPENSLWNGPEPWRRWRNISSDQRRIFFNSSDSLVPSDVNGKSDVYMFEDGQLSLLSDGSDRDGSRFMNASANGDDVFFVTRDRLVPGDRDDLVDVYDARVDGGFSEPESPTSCKSEVCQQPAPPPASTSVAGSASFTAATKRRPARPRVAASRSGPATGARATVKVRTSQPGTVVLSGRGIRRVVKRAPAAATYRLRAVLAPAARSTLAKRGSLRARVQIKFEAGLGGSARTRLTLTFRRREGR
jgi:hypothetical protein